MAIFTFKDLYEIALSRVDEDTVGTDELVLSVIKNGINEGYMAIAALVDKKIDDIVVDYAPTIELPSNFIALDRLEHEVLGPLSVMDYKISEDRLYMNSMGISTGEITLSYFKYPTKLVNDDDRVALSEPYATLPAIYGAYEYQLYKKKYSAAQLLLAEFNSHLPGKAAAAQK